MHSTEDMLAALSVQNLSSVTIQRPENYKVNGYDKKQAFCSYRPVCKLFRRKLGVSVERGDDGPKFNIATLCNLVVFNDPT